MLKAKTFEDMMRERQESEEYKQRRVTYVKDGGRYIDSDMRMTRNQYFNKRGWHQSTTIPKKMTKLVKPPLDEKSKKIPP